MGLGSHIALEIFRAHNSPAVSASGASATVTATMAGDSPACDQDSPLIPTDVPVDFLLHTLKTVHCLSRKSVTLYERVCQLGQMRNANRAVLHQLFVYDNRCMFREFCKRRGLQICSREDLLEILIERPLFRRKSYLCPTWLEGVCNAAVGSGDCCPDTSLPLACGTSCTSAAWSSTTTTGTSTITNTGTGTSATATATATSTTMAVISAERWVGRPPLT